MESSRGVNEVRPELRHLDSADVPDLETVGPPDWDNFAVYIEALIGPQGEPGEEIFGFTVCSASWVPKLVEDNRYRFGKDLLIVRRYDYKLIRSAIVSLCRAISGTTWQEVARRLSQYLSWELDNYLPCRPRDAEQEND